MSKRILVILRVAIKIELCICMAALFALEYLLVYNNPYWSCLYGLVLIVCLVAFVLTFFIKLRKIICNNVYWSFTDEYRCTLLMNIGVPAIKYERAKSLCQMDYHVWDGNEHRCRADCVTWNAKDGCVKDTIGN